MSKPKGKIPRITFGPVQSINLTDENWGTIEASYGHTLSPQVRRPVLEVTSHFLRLSKAEKTGSMKDAVQRATQLRDCARRLVKIVNSPPVEDTAREYVDQEIATQYSLLKTYKNSKEL